MVEHVLAKDETRVRFPLTALGVSRVGKQASPLSSDDVRKALLTAPELGFILSIGVHGEMDITPVFGTGVLGSNPGGRTLLKR